MFKRDGFWAKVLTVLLTVAMTLIATPLDGVAEAVNGTSDTVVAREQENSEKSQDKTTSKTDQKGSSDSASDSNTSETDSTTAKKADGITNGSENSSSADALPSNNESADTTDKSDSESTVDSNSSNKSNDAVTASSESSNVTNTNETEDKSTFKAYWTNAADSETSYTNSDYSANDVSTQKDFNCVPKDNTLHKSTMKVYLKLAGDSKTIYKAGTVRIELPKGFYRGLEKDNPLLAACSDSKMKADGIDQIDWMIPKAPNTNGVTDFNYVEETKDVNGEQTEYYVMQNAKDISGAAELDVDVDYRFRPSMLNVVSETESDGSNKGVYHGQYPVICTVNGTQVGSNTLSVTAKTSVKDSTVTLTHASQDENKGIFFSWDNAWGTKPADADQYFYIVWYATYRRGAGSNMPYTYTLNVDTSKTDGGELVGAKKYTGSAGDDGYEQGGVVLSRMDHTYAGLEGNLDLLQKNWIGISNTPTSTNVYNANAVSNLSDTVNSAWHYQVYALLFRYPLSKVSDAIKNGVDMTKDGIDIGNGIIVTETWQDGYQVSKPVTPSGDTSVKALPDGGGIRALEETRESPNTRTSLQPAVQSIIAEGNEYTLPWYTIHSYNFDSSAAWDATNKTYRASTGFDAKSGSLYCYTAKPDYFGKAPGTSSITANDPMKLSEDEYRIVSFYIEDNEYDAVHVDGLGWQRNQSASTDYGSYKPIEILIRKRNESSFTKYGEVVRTAKGYTFTGVDGSVKTSRIDLPDNTVQIEAKQTDSSFFASDVNVYFNVRIIPDKTLEQRLQKDIEANTNSVIGGFGSGEQTVEGKSLGYSDERLGNYWHRVSYELNQLAERAWFETIHNSYVDDSANDVRSIRSEWQARSWINLGDQFGGSGSEYANPKFMKKYVPTRGTFYVLLPAGTYIKPDEVSVGSEGWGEYPTTDKKVTTIDNWQGSGRTMLEVTVHIKDSEVHWVHMGSELFISYTLYDTYTNIVDRGSKVDNSIVFVNETGDGNVFNSNAKDSSFDGLGYTDWKFYESIAQNAWASGNQVMITQDSMDFGPVTALQSGFSTRVATEGDPSYQSVGSLYLGDSYIDRVQYTAAAQTRTDDIVLYDVFSKDEQNVIGTLESVDVSSIDDKVTYDANDAKTSDTCKPVAYYTTEMPTEQTRSLDSGIWTKTAPEDLSTVKAIAIDCRKTNAGNDFILDKKGTIAAYIHLRASSDSSHAGRIETNEAAISKRMFVGTAPAASDAITTQTANRKVTLLAANVDITKTCDPASGTQDLPAEIGNDANKKLTYTLTIKNNATDTSLPNVRDVHVTDQLPDGLSLDDPSAMTVESDSLGIKAGTKIGSQSSVSYQIDGNKLEFDVSKLPSNGTVAITIPVVRKDPVTKTTDYTNTATIDKVGKQENYNVDNEHASSTTYHRTSVAVMPLSGEAGFGGLIAAGGAVLLLSALAWISHRRHNGEA